VKVAICGLAVDAVTREETLSRIERAVSESRAGTRRRALAVFSANVDMIAKAARDPAFAGELAEADLLLPDGVPLLWMARGLGARLPERVAGSDLVPLLAARAARQGFSLFLLGSAPETARRAAERLARENPGLHVAGTLSPPLGFEHDAVGRERVAEAVRATRPDVVLVALGAPKQERWILSERERAGAAALVAVGGTFDLLAGERLRAPRLVQQLGLEWIWRLAQEPLRLGRRYLWEDAVVLPLYARAAWQRLWRRER